VVDRGAELSGASVRSWLEHGLCQGDFRALSNIALGRSFDGPDLGQVERLCKRGFLKTTRRAYTRMTMKGWFAVVSRNTFAGRDRKEASEARLALVGEISRRNKWPRPRGQLLWDRAAGSMVKASTISVWLSMKYIGCMLLR